MTDQELLQAIRSIVKEESVPITQRLDTVQSDIATMKQDITTLQDSIDEVRSSTNYIAEWVEKLETDFHKHEISSAG